MRKRVAWWLFERENLRSAKLFHATAESEAQSIQVALRRLVEGGRREVEGDRQPRIVVAPNGVEISQRTPNREVVEEKFPELKGRRFVLFMSRIHPKKGLDLLLQAWNERLRDEGQAGGGRRPSVAPNLADSGGAMEGSLREGRREVVLVLAGADLIGYGEEVRRMIREKGLEGGVLMTGHVDGLRVL